MDARQDRMEETQAQIVELLARMDARQDRMEDDLGGIKGSVVEARAQRRMMSLAPARLGLRNAEVVVGPMAPSEALERFSDACRNAGASAEQLDRLVKTDLIIRAQKGAGDDSRRVYLAVEVAYRLDEEDIGRVSESMAVLSDLAPRSTEPDAEVMGAIYGVRIDVVDQGMAVGRGVAVFQEELPQ